MYTLAHHSGDLLISPLVVVVVFKFEVDVSRLVEGWNPGDDEIRGQVVCWAQICGDHPVPFAWWECRHL